MNETLETIKSHIDSFSEIESDTAGEIVEALLLLYKAELVKLLPSPPPVVGDAPKPEAKPA